VGCFTGFVGLVVMDGVADRNTLTSAAAIGASVLAMVMAVGMSTWAFGLANVLRAWRSLGGGLLLALILCAASW
jgi:hypothetical protein